MPNSSLPIIKHTITSSNTHYDYIQAWLKKEYTKKNSGMFSNIQMIERAFKQQRLAITLHNNLPVCFAIFTRYTNSMVVCIDIIETQPEFRKKGHAFSLVQFLESYFQTLNLKIITVDCISSHSIKLAKKIGFLPQHPHLVNSPEYHAFYKIIVPHAPLCIDPPYESISLWDQEYYSHTSKNPKWVWEVKFLSDKETLALPIIHPCNQDWRIQWTKSNLAIINDKVKYFNNQDIYIGNFFYLQQLILPNHEK